jgi:ATP-dependent DNA helicase 2 subunit 1
VRFGIELYAMIRRATRPGKVKISAELQQPVYAIREILCEQTGELLEASDIRYTFPPNKIPFLKTHRAAESGDSDSEASCEDEASMDINKDSDGDGNMDATAMCVSRAGKESSEKTNPPRACLPNVWALSREEMAKVAQVGCQDFALIGFRDRAMLRPEDTSRPGYFVYPTDKVWIGSRKIFASLLKNMDDMGKIAICTWLSDHSTGGPRFVALLPQQAEMDRNYEQWNSPGMHLIFLPYSSDIYESWRDILVKQKEERNELAEPVPVEKGPQSVTRPVGTDVAKRFLRRIRDSKFSVTDRSNPDMTWFYSALEVAAGTSEDGVFNPTDDLIPDDDELHHRAFARLDTRDKSQPKTDLLKLLSTLTLGDVFDSDSVASMFTSAASVTALKRAENSLKRKAVADAKMAAAKENVDNSAFERALRTGTLQKFKVAELKEFCQANSLKTTGVKTSLIDRVERFINDDGEMI